MAATSDPIRRGMNAPDFTLPGSANDAVTYPDDSFDNMKKFAREHGLMFPYLYDASRR